MPLAVATPDMNANIQLIWVHGNHLGVPTVVSDDAGNAVPLSGDYLLPGFPGQSRIFADLYYNRYRDYDPVTGRYLQADPIGLGGGSNNYVYAGSNPANNIDPDGLFQMPIAPNPLLLRVAPQATIFYGLGLTLAAANQWALCRNQFSLTPKEESRVARLRPDPDDPCPAIKMAVQDAISGLKPKLRNFVEDPGQMIGTPGRDTHLNDMKGRIQRIRDFISAGKKLGCDMSSEEMALAQLVAGL
ncbi:RHS repeat-associated core domain-containing protein [Qipengyuania sp. DGS5-3]|uniref:RHS repeat-associated core domain-containing protein n=1 Tax=Qipengyuania sp. DGS5-3 TaxID=3349632 RepID=UPI0036D2BAA1